MNRFYLSRTDGSLLGELGLCVTVVGDDGIQCGTNWMWEMRAEQ